jgi:hypothetical protein
MSNPTRKYSNLILEAMDDGLINPQFIAEALLMYMSEDEVKDFVREYDLQLGEFRDEEEEA